MNKKAYTLVEAVITVVTIGALAAVAIPQYSLSVERAKAREGAYMAKVLGAQILAFTEEHQRMPTQQEALRLFPNLASGKYFNLSYLRSGTDYKNVGYWFILDPRNSKFNYELKYKPSGKVGCCCTESVCSKLGFGVYWNEDVNVY